MIKEHDIFWHTFLYLGLGVGVIAVYLSRFDATRQYLILMMLVLFYLVWGYVYHHMKGDTTRRVILEYLFIGFIALLAGFLVLVS